MLNDDLIRAALNPKLSQEKINAALAIIRSDEPGNANGFISDKQARIYAGGVSHSTLWQWRKNGLKFYSVGGRRFYKSEDLERFITDRSNR